MINQKGYVIQIVLIVFAVIIGMMIFPVKFPVLVEDNTKKGTNYCNDIFSGGSRTITSKNGVIYKLVKENVPVSDHYENDGIYNHYGAAEDYQDPLTGKKYVIRDLGTGGSGRSYQFASDIDPSHPYDIAFADYGIVMLFAVDENNQPFKTGLTAPTYGDTARLLLADVYKRVDTPPLPDWVLKCQDFPTDPATEQTMIQGQNASIVYQLKSLAVMVPDQDKSENKDQLQLEWFLFEHSKFLIHNWWTPHCKPAVYLYPPHKQLVNVKVYPKGELSYADPPYDPIRGWTVWAQPDGDLYQVSSIKYQGKEKYDYLYYESKIKDSEIKKPTKGWVVKNASIKGQVSRDMGELFNEILPKLGLNYKEAKDFKDYWLKTLPQSPYYFVGLIEKDQRDYLETLDVVPAPDTSIRFSLYFEALDQPKVVEEPEITTPARRGFTLVDWGGMVKLHPGTPFTCSQ